MQKEGGASRGWLWVMRCFYDDGKDIIEICRVAAYLNQSINPTGGFRSVVFVKVSAPAGYL